MLKKIGNALKNIICTALGPFQLRLGLVRLVIDPPPPNSIGGRMRRGKVKISGASNNKNESKKY